MSELLNEKTEHLVEFLKKLIIAWFFPVKDKYRKTRLSTLKTLGLLNPISLT
ncbi:MAG: hypothetical protein LBH67_00150 [Rickettsia sp.]|jgi:hypothetical protein|nr:hypothetical protein [Rickettsia sp.]